MGTLYIAITILFLTPRIKHSWHYYYDPISPIEVSATYWAPDYFEQIARKNGEKVTVSDAKVGGLVVTVPLEKLKELHDPKGKNHLVVKVDGTITYLSSVDDTTYLANYGVSRETLESQVSAINSNARIKISQYGPRFGHGNQLLFSTYERGKDKNNVCFLVSLLFELLSSVLCLFIFFKTKRFFRNLFTDLKKIKQTKSVVKA
jgi:hypothetical protein